MMRFFATEFSRIFFGLLILVTPFYGENMNSLKTSDLGVSKQKLRSEVSLQDQWNVEALYSNPSNWKEEFQEILGREAPPHWPELKTYQGRLADPTVASQLFDFYFQLDRKLSKLHTYAHLRLDEDLGNDQFKYNFGLVSSLIHDFQLETSWIEPELLSLSESDFQRLMTHPSLTEFRFYLEKLGRMRPHTLSPELEELMALSGKALDTPYRAFGALNNADLTYRDATDAKGQKLPLTSASYLSYLRAPDRTLRRTAFQNLHQSYEAHANTICELLQGQIQGHVYAARARKFNGCLEAALYPNNIEPIVYSNLIASVRHHLPVMHDYIAMRKKLLGIDEIHPYDLYVPLIEEVQLNIPYKQACELVIESVAPLGEHYQKSLSEGLLENRWVDVYENARKRSGAYSSGCYDSMPYILMNYNGTLNDVLTLAHEAGHSMHSFLSRKNQSYLYSQYPIFVAEVASTFNEQLLLKHLKARAQSKKELATLINYEIEGIRGTIFRQTLFAEFEKQVHEWAEEGIPLTPALLKKHYLLLNRDYYGSDLVLDPELEIEWARIPHFYYNFYVYQYATGLSAALSLFQKALASPEVLEGYLQFLSSGGSNYPLELLKKAGVDMREKTTVDRALDHFAALVKELKECLEAKDN